MGVRMFNKRELKRLRQALYLAIEWEDSCIDSYTVELKIREGIPVYNIPKELKGVANVSKRNIEAFRKLQRKIKELLK